MGAGCLALRPDVEDDIGRPAGGVAALDGFNINTVATGAGIITSTTAVNQPGLSATNFSPKASLAFEPNKDWTVTANFGEAYRYPTVTELYQNVTVNGVATFANPFLTPEQDLNGELSIERKWSDGRHASPCSMSAPTTPSSRRPIS